MFALSTITALEIMVGQWPVTILLRYLTSKNKISVVILTGYTVNYIYIIFVIFSFGISSESKVVLIFCVKKIKFLYSG